MNYFKSVGFYSFELLGGMLNFLCSLLGMYPAFDLGVHFLLYFEVLQFQEKHLLHQH